MANGLTNQLASGTVFRGADGSLYFVRDTLLDSLRVEGEALAILTETLDRANPCEIEDFAGPTTAPPAIKAEIQPIAYVKGSLMPSATDNGVLMDNGVPLTTRTTMAKVASTIMCPHLF